MLKQSCLLMLAVACSQATAAITISDFAITKTGLSFTISGTLPTTAPTASGNVLILANRDQSGHALNAQEGQISVAHTFTGGAALNASQTGSAIHGDYLVIVFGDLMSFETDMNGILTLAWDSEVLDPSTLSHADLYWGVDATLQTATSGVLLDSTVVPEPATYAAIGGFAMLGLVLVRRIRRKA